MEALYCFQLCDVLYGSADVGPLVAHYWTSAPDSERQLLEALQAHVRARLGQRGEIMGHLGGGISCMPGWLL